MKNKTLNFSFFLITITSFLYVYSIFGNLDNKINLESSVENNDSEENYAYDKNIFGLLPKNWTSIKPNSSMRYAEFIIKNKVGNFSLIVFKNIGGSKTQNIDRWYNQFTGENLPELYRETKSMDVNNKKITYIQTSGMFNGGMGQSNPIDKAGLLGFIIEANNEVFYFKSVSGIDILVEGKDDFINTIMNFPLIKDSSFF
ncbi:MAG: hypothetical protein CMF96_07785 [Candidatus Marinimicrobia bacterium]|nr:hypothetical protein [Candidatus Neomarinimicrobiota bacterium]|tara:strand:- start:1947 stop:2546 length:600 start_codon:yes stop_codon:yes gene_type:complete